MDHVIHAAAEPELREWLRSKLQDEAVLIPCLSGGAIDELKEMKP